MDNILQWAQVKMVFRLLRDSPDIDKEALAYADSAIDGLFNTMLKESVPKIEKRTKSFFEMTDTDFNDSVKNDPLLSVFRKADYIYHITRADIEEKEHPISDLLYSSPYNNRFTLVGNVENKDWGIIDSNPVTEQLQEDNTKIAHGVYRIWCFQCTKFFTFELDYGISPDQIHCDICKSVIVEKRKKHDADSK
jgi:hypothetical protein